jgi:SAM-dependent methyltransferase
MKQAENFSNSHIFLSPLDHCPLCGSKNVAKLHIIDKYSPAFKIDKCADCGFLFMNPGYCYRFIKDLYKEDYYSGNAEYSYCDERKAERYSGYVWEKRLARIREYNSSGNFLDAGCAFGGFLKIASQYFTPYGIELSQYSGRYAKTLFGNNIHIGIFENHPFKNDFFSVITMIELLEHIRDPVFVLRESYRLLKESGLLVIQTANMDGLQARFLGKRYAMFLPGHLSYFTKRNLVFLLKEIGFQVVKVYHPVEFGLMPKLLKSRYAFDSSLDYFKWLRIIYYHFISKIRLYNFAVTSSMVIYAVK